MDGLLARSSQRSGDGLESGLLLRVEGERSGGDNLFVRLRIAADVFRGQGDQAGFLKCFESGGVPVAKVRNGEGAPGGVQQQGEDGMLAGRALLELREFFRVGVF